MASAVVAQRSASLARASCTHYPFGLQVRASHYAGSFDRVGRKSPDQLFYNSRPTWPTYQQLPTNSLATPDQLGTFLQPPTNFHATPDQLGALPRTGTSRPTWTSLSHNSRPTWRCINYVFNMIFLIHLDFTRATRPGDQTSSLPSKYSNRSDGHIAKSRPAINQKYHSSDSWFRLLIRITDTLACYPKTSLLWK